jgi:NAD(P)-dependent dehydrogenase (short-subunit alcohol dehydrogenase family)
MINMLGHHKFRAPRKSTGTPVDTVAQAEGACGGAGRLIGPDHQGEGLEMARVGGKVAIVTGAASKIGLGFAAAAALGREGARVVLTDVKATEVTLRASELTSLGIEAVGFEQDVTDEKGWKAIVAATVERFGRVDILVNNAGITHVNSVEKTSLEAWNRQMTVNLASVFLGTRTAIEQFRKQKSRGAIVNVSSAAGIVGISHASAYSASKAGVRLFTKSAALEVAQYGIRVNSVHPGAIRTELQLSAIASDPSVTDAINSRIALGHMGEPEDIGAAILFLASDEAKYITGTELIVDGGLTAA